MTNYLPCEIITTQDKIDASVIWLHGLGANGHDFVPIVPELALPNDMGIRFVFPHAPSLPVTINGGMTMPAWYDITNMSIEREIDVEQLVASSNAITDLIEREEKLGIPSHRIILAGFSQGGAVAYHTALSYHKPLAGLMALSTYFATRDSIKLHDANQSIAIFIGHGTQDRIVPEVLGKQAADKLASLGCKADYRQYPVEHGVHPVEIRDISAWLQSLLKPVQS